MEKEFSQILAEKENLQRIIDSLGEGIIPRQKQANSLFQYRSRKNNWI